MDEVAAINSDGLRALSTRIIFYHAYHENKFVRETFQDMAAYLIYIPTKD